MRSGSPCWAMIGSSTVGESTSSVARKTSRIGSPSQLPRSPWVRIAAAIAIHASPGVAASIRTGARISGGSGLGLLESNHVAGRVAERAVPHAIRLIHRLLQHFATSGPDVLEGRIAVLSVEVDAAQESLGEHLLHDLAVRRGCVRVGERRLEDDIDVRLALGPDGGPAQTLVLDVGAHLEPEEVSVEGERLVMVVYGDEAVVEFQIVHSTTLGAS